MEQVFRQKRHSKINIHYLHHSDSMRQSLKKNKIISPIVTIYITYTISTCYMMLCRLLTWAAKINFVQLISH